MGQGCQGSAHLVPATTSAPSAGENGHGVLSTDLPFTTGCCRSWGSKQPACMAALNNTEPLRNQKQRHLVRHDSVFTVDANVTQPMAKLAELKLKRVQQLNTADSSFMIRKHKDVLNWMMRTFGLDTYALTWAQFFKGVGLGALAMWLLMR